MVLISRFRRRKLPTLGEVGKPEEFEKGFDPKTAPGFKPGRCQYVTYIIVLIYVIAIHNAGRDRTGDLQRTSGFSTYR